MLLNVAVGGNFGGNPNSTTRFPVEMVVDYIRYTPLAGETPAAAPAPQRAAVPARQPAAPAASGNERAELIASHAAGPYTGTIGDYAVWTDGEFDLLAGTVLRITFPKSQAGTKFRLRLLPDRHQANQPLGLDRAIHTVPANGVFEITISPATFGLSESRLHHIEQISVHSGADGFGSLGQGADKQAVFEKIEKVTHRAAVIDLSHPVRSAVLAALDTPTLLLLGQDAADVVDAVTAEAPVRTFPHPGPGFHIRSIYRAQLGQAAGYSVGDRELASLETRVFSLRNQLNSVGGPDRRAVFGQLQVAERELSRARGAREALATTLRSDRSASSTEVSPSAAQASQQSQASRQARARIQRDLGHVLDNFGMPAGDPNAPEYKGEDIGAVLQRDYPNAPSAERAQTTVHAIAGSTAWKFGTKVAKAAGFFVGFNVLSTLGMSAPLQTVKSAAELTLNAGIGSSITPGSVILLIGAILVGVLIYKSKANESLKAVSYVALLGLAYLGITHSPKTTGLVGSAPSASAPAESGTAQTPSTRLCRVLKARGGKGILSWIFSSLANP